MKTPPFRFVFAAATLVTTATCAHAATVNWSGTTSTDWNIGTNWGGAVPSTVDTATFSGAVTSNQPDMSSLNQSVLGLNFGTTTGGWTLSGATTTLTLGAGGIDASAQTSGTTNINVANITLGANQTWKVGSGGTLAVGSAISLADSLGARTLTLEGNVTHSGALIPGKNNHLTFSTTNPGTTSATWTQSGALTIDPRPSTSTSSSMTVNSGVTFDYTGGTAITLKNSSGGSGNANININGGTFVTGKNFNNTNTTGTGAASVNLTSGGTLKLSAAGITQLFTTSGSAIQLTVGTGGGVIDTNSFSTTIDRVVSGAGSLTKKSTGTLTLSGASTYTGDTIVNGGNLIIGSTGSINIATNATGVNIASGATLAVAGALKALSTASGITIASSGTLDLSASSDILDLSALTGITNQQSYKLITNSGGTLNGTFDSITGPSGFTAALDYGTGFVTFTAVPEPSTYGLIGAGALAAVAFVRRRRKQIAA